MPIVIIFQANVHQLLRMLTVLLFIVKFRNASRIIKNIIALFVPIRTAIILHVNVLKLWYFFTERLKMLFQILKVKGLNKVRVAVEEREFILPIKNRQQHKLQIIGRDKETLVKEQLLNVWFQKILSLIKIVDSTRNGMESLILHFNNLWSGILKKLEQFRFRKLEKCDYKLNHLINLFLSQPVQLEYI